MKPASIVSNSRVVRDHKGIPNFQDLSSIRSVFHDSEIVIMVNHYLMNRLDWLRVDKEKFAGEPHDPEFRVTSKSKLKPGVPLREQLGVASK